MKLNLHLNKLKWIIKALWTPACYWEVIKMKVREKPMKYASARKKDLNVERWNENKLWLNC